MRCLPLPPLPGNGPFLSPTMAKQKGMCDMLTGLRVRLRSKSCRYSDGMASRRWEREENGGDGKV